MSATDGSVFELEFSPDLTLISKVRSFAADLAQRNHAGEEWTSQIELATHELVENAVKGSAGGKVRVRIELRRAARAMEIEVRTWNRASRWDLACLQRAVTECSGVSDPFLHYVELIKRTASMKGSGLGIGRVRAECGMQINCMVVGDQACVTAHGRKAV